MYKIISITSKEFSDTDWQRYYILLKSLKAKYDCQLNSESWETLKSRITLYTNINKHYQEYAVFENDKAIAWFAVNLMMQGTDDEFLAMYLEFNYDNIPEQLNKCIVEYLVDCIKELKHHKIYYMAADKRNTSAALRWGAELYGHVNESKLYKDKANSLLMQEWVDTIPKLNQELTLKPYRQLPEKYIDQYVALYSQSIQDIPEDKSSDVNYELTADVFRNDEELSRKNGIVKYNFIIVNELDELIGLSSAYISSKNTDVVDQNMTGVNREYRGRSLAKWLKAAVFFSVEKKYPDFKMFYTQMRSVNEPIQHINKKMGYVNTREGCEFWITVESFEKFLNT